MELALCYGPSCLPGLPKMEVCQEYYGLPPPPGAFGPFLRLSPGDIVELTKAEAEQNWWEVQAGAVRVLEKHPSVGSWAWVARESGVMAPRDSGKGRLVWRRPLGRAV